jgi:hypothetical protein
MSSALLHCSRSSPNSAKRSGSVSPSASACKIRRTLTPGKSPITLESLMRASSNSASS